MKKSLFLTMLAAALMGGQVFAEDAILTAVEGYTYSTINYYMGAYNTSGDASGGKVTVSYSETGSDYSVAKVYGGNSTKAAASSNTAIMTGGQVDELYGGEGKTDASGNTVTMTGGQVSYIYGGQGRTAASGNNTVTMTGGQVSYIYGGEARTAASGNTVIMTGGQVDELYGGQSKAVKTGVASGNVAIVAGDCTVSTFLYGGYAEGGAAANDNKIYLVGKGATATIADAQGKTATYTGGEISLRRILVGSCRNTSTGNSLDIYGTEITAAKLSSMQMLNFHIADGVLLSQEAMVSLTSTQTSDALDLTGVEIGFNAADVQDWGKYEGQTITLVNAVQAITVGEGSLGEVEIKGADGATVATATLGLGNENKSLVMSNIKGTAPVPEPTTGTLSLLALAGLCARRRRK